MEERRTGSSGQNAEDPDDSGWYKLLCKDKNDARENPVFFFIIVIIIIPLLFFYSCLPPPLNKAMHRR